MNSKVKIEILTCLNDLSQKRKIEMNFAIVSLAMESFSMRYIASEKKKQNEPTESIEYYKAAINALEEENKGFEMVLFERQFLNIFYAFEEFCFNIFSILYKNFPKFMYKEDISVSFTDLFEKENIQLLREEIISRKVKGIIQSSNTYKIFNKLKTIFGIELVLDKETLDKLFLIAQKRNVLVHNRGIVNEFFLKEIHTHNISTELKLNDYVLKDISDNKELNLMWDFISDLLKMVSETVFDNLTRITKHSENLK